MRTLIALALLACSLSAQPIYTQDLHFKANGLVRIGQANTFTLSTTGQMRGWFSCVPSLTMAKKPLVLRRTPYGWYQFDLNVDALTVASFGRPWDWMRYWHHNWLDQNDNFPNITMILPNQPALQGVQFHVQAIRYDPGTGMVLDVAPVVSLRVW